MIRLTRLWLGSSRLLRLSLEWVPYATEAAPVSHFQAASQTPLKLGRCSTVRRSVAPEACHDNVAQPTTFTALPSNAWPR
jgi:hypothetical protein